MYRTLYLLLLVALAPALCRAGAIISEGNNIDIGEVTVDGDKISLKTEYGRVRYDREKVIWHTTDVRVKSLLSAGYLAGKQKEWQIARMLLEQSIADEPDTRDKAEHLLGQVKDILAPKAEPAEAIAASSGNTTQAPAEATATIDPADVMIGKINNYLVKFEDDSLWDQRADSIPSRQYYAIYFSAHWCGPCRNFTPKLIKFYHEMQDEHGDKFHVIFYSNDRSAADMATYMEETGMPWYGVSYGNRLQSDLRRYASRYIPDLVIVDRSGEVLYSYKDKDGNRLGANGVLTKFRELLTSK